MNSYLVLFGTVKQVNLSSKLLGLTVKVTDHQRKERLLLLCLPFLHILFLLLHKLHFLLCGFLLADFIIEHAHEVLDVVKLAGQLVAQVVAGRHRLVKLIVRLLHLSYRLCRCHQVLRQLLLDSNPCLVNKGDVLELLVVVCASFVLPGVDLANDSVNLLGQLLAQAL